MSSGPQLGTVLLLVGTFGNVWRLLCLSRLWADLQASSRWRPGVLLSSNAKDSHPQFQWAGPPAPRSSPCSHGCYISHWRTVDNSATVEKKKETRPHVPQLRASKTTLKVHFKQSFCSSSWSQTQDCVNRIIFTSTRPKIEIPQQALLSLKVSLWYLSGYPLKGPVSVVDASGWWGCCLFHTLWGTSKGSRFIVWWHLWWRCSDLFLSGCSWSLWVDVWYWKA